MPPSDKKKLLQYGAVPIIEGSTEFIEDPNISWVKAYAVQQPKEQRFSDGDDTAGVSEYRDLTFAILFLVHLGIFGVTALAYGSFKFSGQSDTDFSGAMDFDLQMPLNIAMAYMVSIALASALVPFFLVGILIPKYTQQIVTFSLYFSVFCNIAVATLFCIAYPRWWLFLILGAIVGYSIWYIRAIGVFIPYAAAILKIASKGVSRHWGVYLVSGGCTLAAIAWVPMWVYVANGVGFFDDIPDMSTSSSNDYYEDDGYATATTGFKMFTLLLSLYWTIIVFTNITQTTVAGIIGTYCFEETSESPSSPSVVVGSLKRSCTTSFGSICFGSLLNAIVTALRAMADNARQSRDREGGAALLLCLLQCVLSILEDIIEYFNQWAYSFVGIHGMTYLESGKAVIEMFQARGCSAILTNGLSMYVLNTVVLFTGAVSGSVGGILFHSWAAFG